MLHARPQRDDVRPPGSRLLHNLGSQPEDLEQQFRGDHFGRCSLHDGAPDTTESIFVPLSEEQILKANAGLVMVSAWTPSRAEGDASCEQQKSFESNPLWERLKGDIIHVDDETFVASVSIQGAHAVITDLAEHYGVDPHLP